MKPNSHLDALRQIYELYDALTGTLKKACRKGCARCCTANVTLTTLEGRLIVNTLSEVDRHRMWTAIERGIHLKRFTPRMTINQMADLCRLDMELPEEQIPDDPDVCPLLEDEACTIYDVRPFGCRCMMSTVSCATSGQAQMADFVLALNDVFLQFIEALDAGGGVFGNLIDILNGMLAGRPMPLLGIPNRPIPVLMIPPDYRQRMQAALEGLKAIRLRLKDHS